jgi:CheY-like chemotaxis protein
VLVRTILIADDEDDFREQIAWCLRAEGYRVITARNGVEAIHALVGWPVDLLFLDMRMPLVDGRAVLQHMDGDPRLARIPVVVVTGKPEEAPRDLFVLAKPISLDSLISAAQAMSGGPHRRMTTPPYVPGGRG